MAIPTIASTGNATITSGAGAFDVGYPSVAAGRAIFLFVAVANGGSAEDWDPGAAGWTPLLVNTAAANMNVWLYVREATGSETGSQSVQYSSSVARIARMFTVGGGDYESIAAIAAQTGTNNIITHPAVVAVGEALAVCCVAYNLNVASGSSGVFEGETGGEWLRFFHSNTASGGDCTHEMYAAGLDDTTLSGGTITLGSNARWHSLTIRIDAGGQPTPAGHGPLLAGIRNRRVIS